LSNRYKSINNKECFDKPKFIEQDKTIQSGEYEALQGPENLSRSNKSNKAKTVCTPLDGAASKIPKKVKK